MPPAEDRRTGARTTLIIGGVLLVAVLLLGARQANRRR
jgi:D-alanyl-D-alanine carboxypeptidase (penicillin-binding protein 5/6)